jgi:hypothetical protein
MIETKMTEEQMLKVLRSLWEKDKHLLIANYKSSAEYNCSRDDYEQWAGYERDRLTKAIGFVPSEINEILNFYAKAHHELQNGGVAAEVGK